MSEGISKHLQKIQVIVDIAILKKIGNMMTAAIKYYTVV
jgi:hypothetical protein